VSVNDFFERLRANASHKPQIGDERGFEMASILYCAVGLPSYAGHRILDMKGFENVKTPTGGIGSWT